MEIKQHALKESIDQNRKSNSISKTTMRLMKIKTQSYKMYGMQQKQSKSKVHRYTGLP